VTTRIYYWFDSNQYASENSLPIIIETLIIIYWFLGEFFNFATVNCYYVWKKKNDLDSERITATKIRNF
jgi:hypothetical protein